MTAPIPFQTQQQEFDDFQQKKKALMEEILGGMTDFQARFGQHPIQQPQQTGQPQAQPSIVPQDPDQAAAQHQDLVARARFWKIDNPEQYSSDQLFQMISGKRAGIQQQGPESTPMKDELLMSASLAAGGAAAKLFGNIIGNIDELPFAGSILGKVLGGETAKNWLYNAASTADEAGRYLQATVPKQQQYANQFASAGGTMVGVVLPMMGAWEGLGAAGAATSRLPWLGQAGSAMARASVRGAVLGDLTVDPNASFSDRALSVGLGGVMGWASQYSRPLAIVAGGGSGALLGAQAGGMIGENDAEKKSNALRMGIAGFALGALAPVFAKSQAKVQADIKSPLDDLGPQSDPGTGPSQQSANPPIPKQLMSGGPNGGGPFDSGGGGGARASATYAGFPLSTVGPDYEVISDQSNLLGNGGVPAIRQGATPQGVGAPQQPRGLLPEAGAASYTNPGLTFDSQWGTSFADHLTFNAQRFPLKVTNGPSTLLGSKVTDINGNPMQVYHGTGAVFGQFNLNLLDAEALYGPGLYHTEDPAIASGYATTTTGMNWIPGGASKAMQMVQQLVTEHPDYAQTMGVSWDTLTPQNVGSIAELLGFDISSLRYPAANVRPAYLSIKNPFDINNQFDMHQVQGMLEQLKVVQPNYDWPSVYRALEHGTPVEQRRVSGQELYDALVFARAKIPGTGVPAESGFNGWLSVGSSESVMGKAGLNQALQQIGYDGITHIGGAITGSPPHRVWIAFQPEQIHQPWSAKMLQADEARAAAMGMTKQASILESQYLPQATAKAEITDSDVIQAQKITNPGGNSVVRNIGDPIQTLKDHPDVTFVRNMDGKLDAMVGAWTPKQMTEYHDWGLWSGQKVVDQHGRDATIINIDRNGGALLRDGSRNSMRVQANTLLPQRWGQPDMLTVNDQTWQQYKSDLLSYMNYNAEQAGMQPVESIWDARVAGEMQIHLDHFLDRLGISDMGQRHSADEFFNQRWTEEAQQLDPEMLDVLRNAGRAASDAATERAASDEPIPVSTEEAAQKRGFIWIRYPGMDGGTLRDNLNPESAFEVPLASDHAAQQFLFNADRAMPDLAPVSEVPAEVAETAQSAESAPFEAHLGYEEDADLTANHVHAQAGSGSGYSGGQEPPLTTGGGGGGGSKPPALGGGNPEEIDPPEAHAENLGDQFEKLRRDDFRKYMELKRIAIGNTFRYTRYLMAKAEAALTKAGIDMGRMWSQYEDLDTARVQSDTWSGPIIEEYAGVMRQFPRPLMRDGTITRIHGIEDPAARSKAFDDLSARGYSADQIAKLKTADAALSDFNQRYFSELANGQTVGASAERGLYRYMVNTAAKQAVGSPNMAQDIYVDDQNNLSPELQFFEDWARQRNLQFRVVDPRTLGNYLIRAGAFDRFQQTAYQNIVDTWSDQRIPEEFRRLMLGHAQAMKYGYDGSGDLAIRGLQGVMQKFGVPITQREAATLLQLPVTGMYRSMLGGRTSIFFRDALQPLLSAAKTDLGTLAGVYRDVLSGPEKVRELWQRGVDGGWVRPDMPAMEGQGVFEQGLELQPFEGLTLSPAEQARREALAQIGDLGAAIPDGIKRLDDATNTLNLYGRLQQLNRVIAGEGAWRQATQGLAEYRASQVENALRGTPDGAMTYEQLADRVRFSSFEQPIQRKLNDLVEAGNDEEASNLFAREVTNWSQFKYGRAEQPSIVRGFAGRLLYTFGNFSGQFLEAMNSAVRNGTPAQKVRAAMVVGSMAYGLHELEQKTGWSFGKMAWTNSLKYAGGPAAQGLATGYEALTGALAASEGRTMSPTQQSAIQQMTSGHPFLEGAASVFPWTGYLKSARELNAASQGDTPGQQAVRYLITGDRGNVTLGPGLSPEEQRQRVMDIINQSNSHPGAGVIQP